MQNLPLGDATISGSCAKTRTGDANCDLGIIPPIEAADVRYRHSGILRVLRLKHWNRAERVPAACEPELARP